MKHSKKRKIQLLSTNPLPQYLDFIVNKDNKSNIIFRFFIWINLENSGIIFGLGTKREKESYKDWSVIWEKLLQ